MKDCISKNAYVNNKIISAEEVQKALFTGNTTVYEVIRIIDGRPLFIEDHLGRLEKSASLLQLHLCYSASQIYDIIIEFIKHEGISIGNIKLQFTFDNNKSLFLLYQSQHSYPKVEMYAQGVITKTLHVERENPNAKNIQSFHSVAQSFIKEHDLYEALLIDKDNNITEGSKSNIFFIKENTIITALASDVLLGITRKYVIEAALLLGLKVEERKISMDELPEFDSAFISGTSPKILPIKTIDSKKYKTDTVVLLNLMSKLEELIHQNIETQNK